MTEQEVTDSAFMGPWLANNIRQCDGFADMMSYWTFSDVFEEQGVVKTPFYGGYGLVAVGGIPKAAFRIFELLHGLGDRRLAANSENVLATKRRDGTIVIALWNYAEPGENVAPKAFRLDVKNSRATRYRVQFVDPGHGPVAQLATLGLVFVGMSAVYTALLAFAAGSIGQWLKRHRSIGRWQGRVVGTIYLALCVRLALQER